MRRITVTVLICLMISLSLSAIGCCCCAFSGIGRPSDIHDVNYAVDGKHVFYVEEWDLSGLDTWYDRLVYNSVRQKDRRVIYQVPSIDNVAISPSGRYLALTDDVSVSGPKLVIMNTESFSIIKRIEFSDIYPMDTGWHPKGEKLYYTDQDGICLFDVRTSKKERLIEGEYYILSWAKDGEYFLYTESYGTVLFLFDYEKRASKLLTSDFSSSTYDDNALLDMQKRTAVDGFDKPDGSAEIVSINLDTLQSEALWQRKPKREGEFADEPISIEKLHYNDDRTKVVFYTAAGGYAKNDGIYVLSLKDRRAKRIVSLWQVWSPKWDYSPKTNKVIWEEKGVLKEKELD